MSRDTFIAACKFCYDNGHNIFIGGGEPTVHPLFWDFIGIALAYDCECLPGLVTNGKKAEDALKLSRLAKRGVLTVDLSVDKYHETIDNSVIKAFKKEKNDCGYLSNANDNDYRAIRSGNVVIAAGRGKKIKGSDNNLCCCPELVVNPDGNIWACGCLNTQFGTIFQPNIPDDFEQGECFERKQ